MDDQSESPSDDVQPQIQDEDQPEQQDCADKTRRVFLGRSARKLAYAAPVVLLFKPKAACASGGSQITQA